MSDRDTVIRYFESSSSTSRINKNNIRINKQTNAQQMKLMKEDTNISKSLVLFILEIYCLLQNPNNVNRECYLFFFFPYFSYVEVMDCKLRKKKKWRDHVKKKW